MKDIIWRPLPGVVERSNIHRFMLTHGIKDYDELVTRSVDDIEWFWDAVMKDLGIEWYRPYKKVMDTSKGIQWTRWFADGKINIVHNCLDRHINTSRAKGIACIWEGDDGEVRKVTYRRLFKEVNRLANALRDIGIKKGDTVGIYMPMTPEIVSAMYAILKIGAICIPIFSGFAGSAVSSRLKNAGAKALFTADGSLRRNKTIEIKKEADKAVKDVPSIKHVIVLRRLNIDVPWEEKRDIWYHEFIKGKGEKSPTEQTESEDYSLLLYTSGTTGRPKGSVHTHGGCMAQICKELAYYFDVKPEDKFFWLTDIGWMMGPWMIIGVHSFGGTILIFEGAPDYPAPDRLWDMIERHKITIFGISPTAIRMLMRSGEEWVHRHDMTSLRILGSTGEAWDDESYMWFFEKIGRRKLPIINISGGTEIVGCFLSPLPITPLKPCTLRGPGLGMDVDVFDEDGNPVRGVMGHLVCKKPAPSMTRGFWNDRKRYIETYWSRWKDIWFHGDWAKVDKDGYWSLHGRSDDTIKVAGRRTGPAEIESALIEHLAVSEAAAVGVPHGTRGEDIVCFVVLKGGFDPDEGLREELKRQVVKTLGKTFRPGDMRFVSALPKTRSAKIVRRVIRAKYMGEEDLGDLSSIENPSAIDEIGKAV